MTLMRGGAEINRLKFHYGGECVSLGMRIGSQTEVDATHWVLLGLTIPMAAAFGFMMPKNSVNKGPEFAMAYLAAMIFVFVGLEHIFDHRAAVFAAASAALWILSLSCQSPF